MGRSRSYNLPDGGLYYGELNASGLPESLNASGIWDDGKRYVGQWKDGQISGVGTLYYPDGREIYGYWWEGELLHEFKKVGMPSDAPLPSSNPSNQPAPPKPQGNYKVAALLIGNNKYSENALNNCIVDVEAIGSELNAIGVDVAIIRDANMAEMKNAIERLSDRASIYENVFFFFSGHGASIHGLHFLLSIDNKIISLEEIDSFLSGTDYKNIILVSDACTTILPINLKDENEIDPPKSAGRTLQVFSSSLGSSWDGIPGEHSPFVYGLLQYISQPMSVEQIFSEANKFAAAYALNHKRYQIPQVVTLPFFNRDFYLYTY